RALLGFDRARRVAGPSLAVGFGLLLDALALGIGDATRLGEDLLGVAPRLADQSAVLLDELARLLPRAVGLLERLPDPLPPLVDQLLDRAEGVALEDEERDREADQGQ